MKKLLVTLIALSMLLTLAACTGEVDPFAVTLAEEDFVYTESTQAPPTEVVFERLSVYEGDDYSITITGIRLDDPEGITLSTRIYNNTEETTVTKTEYIYETVDGEKQIVGEQEIVTVSGTNYRFVVASATANGIPLEVSFATELTSNDRSFEQIVLKKDADQDLGTVTEIQILFEIYLVDGERLISTLPVTIYPYGDLSQ